MYEFRVTKYNPAHRDAHGAYLHDEWTSASDIGRSFAGAFLTESDYQQVEDAYAATAVTFMQEAGVSSLVVTQLDNHGSVPLAFGEGSVLDVSEAAAVIRRVLREEFWCKLEATAGFVHLGYDYYMYIGVLSKCPTAEKFARQVGLFVEEFKSPHRD